MAFADLNRLILGWFIVILFISLYADVVGVIVAMVYEQRILAAEISQRQLARKTLITIVSVVIYLCFFVY